MKKTQFSQWILIGWLFVLTACQSGGEPLSASVSGSSEPIAVNGMSLATGAAGAAPLWAFCSAAPENTHIRTFDCRVPAWQTLAVGHHFLLADAALSNGLEDDLSWELAIDDYMVDLESFGTFDSMVASMPAGPSPTREVFARMTDWNLVMTDLNPGEHTLSFRAQRDGESYMWLVRLVIEPADSPDVSEASSR